MNKFTAPTRRERGFYTKDGKVYELVGFSTKSTGTVAVLAEVESVGKYYITLGNKFVEQSTFRIEYRKVRTHKG